MAITMGIDPGSTESGWAVYDTERKVVISSGKWDNLELLSSGMMHGKLVNGENIEFLVVEMLEGRSQRTGQETMDAAMWAGRFAQKWDDNVLDRYPGLNAVFLMRRQVKTALGVKQNAKGADAEIWGTIVNMHGMYKTVAVGTKKKPGPLYGVTKDARQALALVIAFHIEELSR